MSPIQSQRNLLTELQAKKAAVFLTTMLVVLNSSMGSSLTGNAIQSITKEFAVESQLQKALPMSIFLVGKYSIRQTQTLILNLI